MNNYLLNPDDIVDNNFPAASFATALDDGISLTLAACNLFCSLTDVKI